MPDLDLDDLIFDPLFAATCGAVQVTRNVQTVDSTGRAVIAPTTYDITTNNYSTVVTPANGATLRQFPEMQRVEGSIQLITNFSLQVATDTTAADIVTFDGKQYTITNMMNYLPYGQGFVIAVGTMIQLLSNLEDIPC